MDVSQWLRFIHLSPFVRKWKDHKLGEEDLRRLEWEIISQPDGGAVMAGTGGVRKMRFAPPNWKRGKSGALRVCYAHFRAFGTVALIT